MTILKTFGVMSCLLYLASAFHASAQSQTADNMTTWKEQAGAVVSDTMNAPGSFELYSNTYHEVNLTIDRNGVVEDAQIVSLRGHPDTRLLTRRTLRKLESLPALPASFPDEKARVKLYLIYALNDRGLLAMQSKLQKTRQIRIQDIAANETPWIEIASAGK